MKLLGYELVRAQARPPSGELGATGTSVMASGGQIILTQEDYNPDLRGRAFYEQIDRMRLSDGQVGAAMTSIKQPLLSADWAFEPASDAPEQQEITDWLNDRFFNHQMRTWHYVLRHILLSLDFGVMPFELVWQVVDDDLLKRPMVHLTKMAPRLPRTVSEWRLTEEGDLDGITQWVDKDGRYQEVQIPGEKLLVFVHDMEGANYHGTSILRQARKHWWIKERFERISQVAVEKRAAGIDVGMMPEGVSNDATKKAFENALQTMRTHERNYLLLPFGYQYQVAGLSGGVMDPLPYIQYADAMILRSLLVDFLVSGTTGPSGSWAMVTDRSSLFLMGLEGVANEIMAPINRDLIPRWVRWNWPNVTEYPQLSHSRLNRRDVAMMADALSKLIPQGVITPDPDIEREYREMLDLPELKDDAPLPPELPDLLPDQMPGLDDMVEEDDTEPDQLARRAIYRPRTIAERSVDWVILARGLDSAEDQIISAYRDIQRRQVEKLVDEAVKALGSPKSADERAEMLMNLNVPYKREAAAAIAKVLISLHRLGQQEVRQELRRRGGEPLRLAMPAEAESDSIMQRLLRFRALAMVRQLADRLLGSVLNNGLNMAREGLADRLILTGVLATLSDKAIRSAAGTVVTEALNLGRESVAKRNELLVRRAEYSAILDEGTCDACAVLDQQDFQFGSAQYEAAKPPRPAGGAFEECHGRNRCRCVMIFEFSGEAS